MTEPDRSTLEVLRGSRILAYTVGVVLLVAGLVLLVVPDRSVFLVARIAGALIAIVGIAEIVETLSTHRQGGYWWLLLLRALCNLLVGALLLFWPDITLTLLVWVFGLDLLVTGVIGLFASRRVPPDLGRSTLVLRSVTSIVFGLFLVAWPSATLQVVSILVGIILVGIGALLLWSGYRLGKVEGATTT